MASYRHELSANGLTQLGLSARCSVTTDNDHEPWKNSWTDLGAVCGRDLGDKVLRIRWRAPITTREGTIWGVWLVLPIHYCTHLFVTDIVMARATSHVSRSAISLPW